MASNTIHRTEEARPVPMTRRYYRNRKKLMMACLTCGTVMQLGACTDDVALFGINVAVSSITLPFNAFVADVLTLFF